MNATRTGLGLIKYLTAVIVLSVLTVLAWGVYANWDRDADADGAADGFTFRPLDEGWWATSRERAEPMIAKGRAYVDQAKEKVWGDGGFVDEANEWLEARRKARELARRAEEADRAARGDDQATDAPSTPSTEAADDGEAGPGREPAPGTHAVKPARRDEAPDTVVAAEPASAAAVTTSPRTRRLEEQYLHTEEVFAEGLEYYQRADPRHSQWDQEKVDNVAQARDRFLRVQRQLDEFLNEYPRQDDHDAALLGEAQELSALNQKLLYNANKMYSPM